MRAEHENLETLARSRDAEFRESVPRPYGFIETSEIDVLFESVVGGEPVQVPCEPSDLAAFADRMTDWVLAFHRATGVRAERLDGSLFQRIFIRPFEAYDETFRPGHEEARFLARMRHTAESIEDTRLPLVFAHGDLCPPNIFVDGERLGIIDWETPFEASAPAHDLIHLFTCLGAQGSGRDGLLGFRKVFFEENPLSVAARRSLVRYARALGIPEGILRLLFTIFWLEYALEKARRATQVRREAEGIDGLALLGEGTCLNVRWLAQNEARLLLP